MSDGRYILAGKIPVPCDDLFEWAEWFETHWQERVVQQDQVGNYWVSTVFLAVDYNWIPDIHPPALFETMVFEGQGGGEITDYLERTSTWELALEQHAEAVVWAKERLS